MKLKNKTDLPVAQRGAAIFVERERVGTRYSNLPFVGAIERAEQMQQGTLADTRGSHNGYRFARSAR
jgi:hypothetical protein